MTRRSAPAAPVSSAVSATAPRWQFVPDEGGQPTGERTSSVGIVAFTLMVFALVYALIFAVGWAVAGAIVPPLFFVALAAAVLVAMGVHIAQQWERVVVLRLGKFNRVSGPGLFWTIPFVEQNTARIDCRVRATTFDAKETLTSDLVPLDVNAVLLWMVYDAKAACTECSDFSRTVELAAQAALRDAIGRLSAAEVAIRREQLDADIKEALENEAAQWGLSVLSVKVRDILLPQNLQDVMSLEAQAEQRRKARLILMEAEQDIAAMIEGLDGAYGAEDAALKLRAMHLLYESVRETGGTVVVPSSFSEGFGDVLPEGAKRALGKMGS
ncbi:slipin family protein [Adlercreutzia mucosicola]|uniref:Slipin family protein n=1 Tax=Adlercreutzia mucosicola TaxID=580026 RepID=A0A6N8JQE9_9ACTN|nr:slipin family protein [Adlercreutzia mucosicola]MCI9495671.1 slipin family protein [Adlercreutzia mucosicola]MCR2034536.1 slipin family protein [Adlercreutzia mucosicola]MVX61344.1 slipin family protein [Adlercreutzia mucosicola]